MSPVASLVAQSRWLRAMRQAFSGRGALFSLARVVALLILALSTGCSVDAAPADAEALGSSSSELQNNCGCGKTGAYVPPALAAPATSSRLFAVSTSVSIAGTSIKVTRSSDGAAVFSTNVPVPTPSSPLPAAYGFSPDGAHFLYHYVQQGIDNAFLVDLSTGVGRTVYSRAVVARSVAFEFSPQGRYLVHAYLTGNDTITLELIDATTGASAYATNLRLFTQVIAPPGGTLDVAGWGFSPDEESFVTAHVSGQGIASLNLVNVVRGSLVASRFVTSSAFWAFSPCGDAFGLAEVSRIGDATVTLWRTSDGRTLGSVSGRALPGGVQLSVTSAAHVARINQTTFQVSPNTAGSTCPPPTGLVALTFAPSEVVGGQTALLTLTLATPAPARGAVIRLKSSMPELVSVPTSVVVPAQTSTASVSITTRPTPSAVQVSVTGTFGSTTRSGVLRVTPVLRCGGTICAPPSQCQAAVSCSQNRCKYTLKPVGTACDDKNPSTMGDACNDGACIGTDRCAGVSCAGGPCRSGACDHVSGACVFTPTPTGTACDDGNPQTTNDVCSSGTCAGVDLCAGVSCANQACHVSACNPASGVCDTSVSPDGTACDDGDAQTTGDVCAAGVCAGSPGSCVETNLSLNPAAAGFPDPTESDRGWGGGSYPWQIVDGLYAYDTWAAGLAFTGGHQDASGGPPWIEPAGVRHAVIDLGSVHTFHKIVLWWHGVEYTPLTGSVEYWDGAQWLPAQSVQRVYGALHAEGSNSGYSDSDSYTFDAVSASKVRYTFDNSGLNILGTYNIHGWLYEFEVYGCP